MVIRPGGAIACGRSGSYQAPTCSCSGAIGWGVLASQEASTDDDPDSLTDTGRSCRALALHAVIARPGGNVTGVLLTVEKFCRANNSHLRGEMVPERAQGWSAGEPRQSNA